ncbi:hypothetical protein [Promicromonospora soli]
MDERLITLSEITTALVTVGALVPHRTVQSWAHRGRLVEHLEFVGVPWSLRPSGLYRFADAFTLATRRATRVRVEGSAA